MRNFSVAFWLLTMLVLGFISGHSIGKRNADRWWQKQHIVSTVTQTYDGIVVRQMTSWYMSNDQVCIQESKNVIKSTAKENPQ